jgi:hypothetical protein
MQEIVQTIKSAWDAMFAYLDDVMLSMQDFIKDLPTIFIKGLMSLATDALEWASSASAGVLGDGTGLSMFAQQIQATYNALPPCVIYTVTQSGMVANMQVLSAAAGVIATMRVLSFIKALL